MIISIEIECDSDAFTQYGLGFEAARIIGVAGCKAANRLAKGNTLAPESIPLSDLNGMKVGKIEFFPAPAETVAP